MQDLLIAIIVSWILFRIFRPVVFVQWNGREQSGRNSNSYSQQNQQREEKIKVKQNKNQDRSSSEAGEYVDYEDLPYDNKN